MEDTQLQPSHDPLSARELEILGLIEKGYTNREIAQKLVLALETIKWHNKQIFSKIGAHNRAQAIHNARAAGILGSRETVAFQPRHNLPAPVTSFIGRKREIAEIKNLLASTRLLTLSGPPGTGKTRLAKQIAWEILADYKDGVYFIDLTPIHNPQFFTSTIARVLEIREAGSLPLIENLKLFIQHKQLLLVLDNFEQIIETAPLISELLSAAPGLKILVTSRQVLQIYGEQEYYVLPLAVPCHEDNQSLSTLSQFEAVELFYHRARAVEPNFILTDDIIPAIIEVCARLDGLPLAIELAAAHTKLLSPEMMRRRLETRLGMLTTGSRQLPSRMRTLRGTIDWSYNLLDPDEKKLLARLSVFLGGRTIESVEAVCAPGLSITVIVGMESLLNKSLLIQESGPNNERRFYMLETIHEYAREKLTESGEADNLRDMHASYFMALVEQAEPGLCGDQQGYWLTRLRSEFDNLRAALDWVLESDLAEIGLRIVGALRDFWYYGGHIEEGLRWTLRVLENTGDPLPGFRAKALNAAGCLSSFQGDYENGRRFNSEALTRYLALGDKTNQAWAMIFLCANYISSPDEIEEGIKLCEAGLVIFREQENKPGLTRALNQLGELARRNQETVYAGKAYAECYAISCEIGDRQHEAFSLANLGLVAQHQGHYEQAESYMRKSLARFRDLKFDYPIAKLLAFLSGPVAARGFPERAAQLLGASEALLKAMGAGLQPPDQPEIDRFRAAVREKLDEETFRAAWTKGQAMSLEQALIYALDDENK